MFDIDHLAWRLIKDSAPLFVFVVATIVAALLLVGCVSAPLPSEGAPDLARGDLARCAAAESVCAFVDGGIEPCGFDADVGADHCYRGNVERTPCLPSPDPSGYAYVVVEDCASCAMTCAP